MYSQINIFSKPKMFYHFTDLQILVLEGNVITRKLLVTNLNYTSTLLSDHLVFGPKFIFDYLEEH